MTTNEPLYRVDEWSCPQYNPEAASCLTLEAFALLNRWAWEIADAAWGAESDDMLRGHYDTQERVSRSAQWLKLRGPAWAFAHNHPLPSAFDALGAE